MTTNTSATTIHNEAATNTPIHSNIEPQRIIVTQRQRKCYRRIPITLQRFRSLLSCLPTLSKKARDDSIFGAARFLANGLGIKLIDKPSANVLDESLSQTQYKQLWRTATFYCKCSLDQRKTINYETRSLCLECSYLIHRNSMNIPIPFTLCPSCNMIESWECLSCQFVSIIHQNPYSSRYERFLQT